MSLAFHPAFPSHPPRLCIVKVVSTQRAARAVGAFEPSEQADTVKRVAARPALFVGRLHVGPDDAVADGAFTLSLERPLHVAPECNQSFDDAARAEDDDLECPHPRLPILL